MQQWGNDYRETNAPVVSWINIRYLLVLSEIVGLESQAIDFVVVFPQEELNVPLYMELPIRLKVSGTSGERKMYILSP